MSLLPPLPNGYNRGVAIPLGSPGAAISDDLLPDDELDHDKTSMGNRDAQPENNESLGDDRTVTGEKDSPDQEQQSLGDVGTHGSGGDE